MKCMSLNATSRSKPGARATSTTGNARHIIGAAPQSAGTGGA